MMSRAGWLTLHIADGENAGRVILLPADRIVAVVDLEGGAGLAYDDGGTMQVRETAAEVAELLEDVDGSVVTLEGVRTKRADRETAMRAIDEQLREVQLERFAPPFVPTTHRVQVIHTNPVMLEPGAYAMVEAPTRAGDIVQRVLIQVTGRSSSGEAVTDCAHAFAVASSALFANAHKVPCAMFTSENVPALGNFHRPVSGPVSLELSSNYHLPAYVAVTLFVQREE